MCLFAMSGRLPDCLKKLATRFKIHFAFWTLFFQINCGETSVNDNYRLAHYRSLCMLPPFLLNQHSHSSKQKNTFLHFTKKQLSILQHSTSTGPVRGGRSREPTLSSSRPTQLATRLPAWSAPKIQLRPAKGERRIPSKRLSK